MTSEVLHSAIIAWAFLRLPGRLKEEECLKLLNCSKDSDDVSILISAGVLPTLGKPRKGAVKYVSAIELITLMADPKWLAKVTDTLAAYWRRKNARREGGHADDAKWREAA